MIPHSGTMCLLDEIVRWDQESAFAKATSHRSPEHPLREQGRLGIVCAAEYAAQVMAVHAGLMRDSHPLARPAPGRLVQLKDMRWSVERLDDIVVPLMIEVRLVYRLGSGSIYGFAVSAGQRALASGRASVMLAGEPAA